MSQKDVDAGEQCMTCGAYIFALKPPGYRRDCDGCKSLHNSADEVTHRSRLRCPKCGDTWNVFDGDSYELLAEGVHDATCPECDHDFEITTYVSHSFESPALDVDEEGGDET